MTGFKIPGFNLTSVSVSDLDRTIRFFVEACGFEMIRPPGRAVIQSRLSDTGSAHAGLDVDDIEAAGGFAREHGFELVGEIVTIDSGPNAGRRVAYTRDPDGVTVEYLQAPAGGAQ